jgi:YD repeat-containing protein
MSQEREDPREDKKPAHRVTKYDAFGRPLSITDDPYGQTVTYVYDAYGHAVGGKSEDLTPAPPAAPAAPARFGATAHLTQTFEFRLSGSEVQEQREPFGRYPGAMAVLGITGVRAYLTRQGETTGPLSAIGGLEVSAELDRKGFTCRAGVGDFGPADLVVVQVDVAVYFR